MQTITIPTPIGLVSAKSNGRYSMASVQLSEGEAGAIASTTDGHHLAVVQCEGAIKGKAMIPANTLPKRAKGSIVQVSDDNARYTIDGAERNVPADESALPPLKDVTPEYGNGDDVIQLHLNAKVLYNLAKAIGSDRISLIASGPNKPITVVSCTQSDTPNAIGVIMPLNTNKMEQLDRAKAMRTALL